MLGGHQEDELAPTQGQVAHSRPVTSHHRRLRVLADASPTATCWSTEYRPCSGAMGCGVQGINNLYVETHDSWKSSQQKTQEQEVPSFQP